MIGIFLTFVGIVGVGCIIAAYFLLQYGRLQSSDLRYPLTNLIGSILILLSLIHAWNLPSFIIEICWIMISLFGILKIVRSRQE
jgi:hypothetical protein